MSEPRRFPGDTIPRLFRLACAARADRDLFADEVERFSGARADALTDRLAAGLRRLGLAPGDGIAFLAGPSARHALLWFAAQKAGLVCACLHTRETPARTAEVVAWLEARVVIADPALMPLAAALPASVTVLDRDADFAALSAGDPVDLGDPRPDDPAAIILSSGTTGRPKGVLHSQRTLTATAMKGSDIYARIGHNDSTLVMMGPSFAAWVHIVLPYVAARARVVFGRAFSPEGFLKLLETERITMAPLVPTMWRMVLAANPGGYDLSALKLGMFSGEPGDPALVEAMTRHICPEVFSVYLATEGGNAAGCVADTVDLTIRGKAASAGRPVPGGDIRIVDPDGPIDAPLAPGETGEIVLAGASLAEGYWKDEALTRSRFVAGWWRSGDLGLIDAEGDLFLKGRLDNVINSGGIKVHAEEVESAILRHPAIRMAAVVGVPDPVWGSRIEAHVVAGPEAPGESGLQDFLRDAGSLAAPKIPKRIHFTDALPTGPTGKLYRRALREG